MPAYLICRVRITDPEAYARYVARTAAIISEFGGQFLARGGAVQTLEGEPFDGRIVLVEFPSMQAAQDFYESEAYRESRRIRAGAAHTEFIVVEGV